MSISSCDHCWSNPCQCGRDFTHLSSRQIRTLIDTLKVVLADKLMKEQDENDSWDRGGMR